MSEIKKACFRKIVEAIKEMTDVDAAMVAGIAIGFADSKHIKGEAPYYKGE